MIVGSSGSGKTTMLQCIAGLLPPSGGEIHLSVGEQHEGGSSMVSLNEHVGMVFQFPERHFLAATVLDELTFGWCVPSPSPSAPTLLPRSPGSTVSPTTTLSQRLRCCVSPCCSDALHFRLVHHRPLVLQHAGTSAPVQQQQQRRAVP
jgi:ABC-type oligopeptide transport system ATPase subunit